MAEPREASLHKVQEIRDAKIQAFRDLVQREHDTAVAAGNASFSADIPSDLPVGWEEEVAEEWRTAGWTVTRGRQHTDSYLSFS